MTFKTPSEAELIWATCANRLAAEFETVKDFEFGDRSEDARIVREVKIKNPALSFDGVVLLVEPSGEVDFVGIEAQTIDTRGGAVKPLWEAYRDGQPEQWRSRYASRPAFGVNSANVWKRLLPQVINKGRMYADWDAKLYVIVQSSLLQFIRRRMHLHELSGQERDKAQIIWLPWDYQGGVDTSGQRRTALEYPVYTTVDQVQAAFTSIAAAQRPVFVEKALAKLAKDDKAVRRAAAKAAADAAEARALFGDEDS